MKRVVVDTNIIISGTFWRGTPLEVLKMGEAGQYTWLRSDDLAAELHKTLNRRKFDHIFAALGIMPTDVIGLYLSHTEKVSPAEIPADAVRDAKDIPVLACAVGGQADVIVSGDKDLLALGKYANIPILNAAQFLEELASAQADSSLAPDPASE
jgi:uncharacterized protein